MKTTPPAVEADDASKKPSAEVQNNNNNMDQILQHAAPKRASSNSFSHRDMAAAAQQVALETAELNIEDRNMSSEMQQSTDCKAGFSSSRRSLSRKDDSDTKAKAAAETASRTWSGAVTRIPSRRRLEEAAQETNQQPSSSAEDAQPGAFPIADGGADDHIDDSLIDLDTYDSPPETSHPSNVLPPEADFPSVPVAAALDSDDIEARIRTTVEQQIHEFRQEDMRARDSDVAQATPTLVTHATRIDEDVPKSQEMPENPRYCKPGWIILVLVILLGIGVGVALAVTFASQASAETPNEITTNSIPPTNAISTTSAPSPNPTAEPQSDEFFALLDILEPVLAESPTFNNRTSLQDPSTVEYQVLDWMANHADGLSDDLAFNSTDAYSLLERYAIAVAYHRLDGNSWKKQFRFLTGVPVCRWNDATISKLREKGISCINDVVTSIGLRENSLSGPLPPELFHLTMLVDLMLGINEITGTIPTEIGRLSRLELFTVFYAELTGTIPTEIGMLTNLLDFHVYSNLLTGTIPTEIGNMIATNYFGVDTNRMDGTIPSEIGMMSNLLHFYAYINDFTGTVPTEVQQLTLLQLFDIELTQIRGDLDPLFCDGTTLNFGPDGQLSSNCLASEDGTPPIIKCTCCTWCCNNEPICEKQY